MDNEENATHKIEDKIAWAGKIQSDITTMVDGNHDYSNGDYVEKCYFKQIITAVIILCVILSIVCVSNNVNPNNIITGCSIIILLGFFLLVISQKIDSIAFYKQLEREDNEFYGRHDNPDYYKDKVEK